MKKSTLRFFALVLSLTLLTAVLSGCSLLRAIGNAVWNTGISFEDLKYEDYDMTAFNELCDEISKLLDDNADSDVILSKMDDLSIKRAEIYSMYSLATIYNAIDVTDEKYADAVVSSYEKSLKADDDFSVLARRVTESDCADAAREYWGDEAFEYYSTYEPMTQEDNEFHTREQELINEYNNVLASDISVTYNGVKYFYLKNAQGDVTGLVNASGTQVVSYTYDPWGAPMSTDGTMAVTLGAANPLRYRGYVYDSETGLYYLSSRYYNPVWGRFINADGYASTGQGFTGYNMFAYCNGNPLRYRDSSGMLPRNTMTMMTDTGGGKIAFLTMFNYALNPYITDSNIYGSLITGLDSGREGLTNYCVGSIKQDPCPPNIGIGIFEKQRQAELSNIRSVNAGFQKAFSVMAYGSALIDVGVGVRNNLASDAPFKKVAIDATVDAVYSGGAVFISAKAGALIGGCIGGPVGAFVGIFAGYLTGIGLYYLTDLMYVDGKNIRTWQKEYLYLW